jgi:hypothetical protein
MRLTSDVTTVGLLPVSARVGLTSTLRTSVISQVTRSFRTVRIGTIRRGMSLTTVRVAQIARSAPVGWQWALCRVVKRVRQQIASVHSETDLGGV